MAGLAVVITTACCAGAARAAESQSQASKHAVSSALPAHLADGTLDPGIAGAQPTPQPFAAAATAVPPFAAVAPSPPMQLPQPYSTAPSQSISDLDTSLLPNSSAAVPLTVNSAGEQQPQPAELTGVSATAVGSSDYALGHDLPLQSKGEQVQDQAGGQEKQQENTVPVRGLADPNKRLLAKMGGEVAGEVSKQLLQEVGARSHVHGLLQVSNCSRHVQCIMVGDSCVPSLAVCLRCCSHAVCCAVAICANVVCPRPVGKSSISWLAHRVGMYTCMVLSNISKSATQPFLLPAGCFKLSVLNNITCLILSQPAVLMAHD